MNLKKGFLKYRKQLIKIYQKMKNGIGLDPIPF